MAPNNRLMDQANDLVAIRLLENTTDSENKMCYIGRTNASSSNGKETTKDMLPMGDVSPAGASQLRRRAGSTSFGSPSVVESDASTTTTAKMTETSTSRTSSGDFSTLSSSGISSAKLDKMVDDSTSPLELEKYPIVQVTVPLFLFLAIGTKYLAKNMPYAMAPWAATHTYVPAHWTYDPEETHFDNSAWTWGTDYFLAVLMTYLAVRCLTATGGGDRCEDSYQLRLRSASLLVLYAISTLAGGYAHQFYTSIDDLNTTSFRVIWTVCVGTVTSAGASMLWIGSELCRRYHANVKSDEVHFRIPTVPKWFCVAWGLFITGICVTGGMSYKRPACDIFVAGTTQVVPTAYLILLLVAHKWSNGHPKEHVRCEHPCDYIKPALRVVYCVGFLLNCPLLPMYPLLVQYTDWSLGAVNTLLHTWLTISWGMQAIGLQHFCLALNKGTTKA